jgi:hypothetical protein
VLTIGFVTAAPSDTVDRFSSIVVRDASPRRGQRCQFASLETSPGPPPKPGKPKSDNPAKDVAQKPP